MKIFLLVCPALFLLSAAWSAPVPAEPLGAKGKLLFSDDFERKELGEWKSQIPAFTVADGVLQARQARAEHGAVGRVQRPMRDVIVTFKFMLEGSTTFNAVFDDQAYKGSHAGHICRVVFAPKQVRLGDDKEGVMRNDIFALRRDPARKTEADALLVGRSATGAIQLEQQRWHHAVIEIVGDRMRVSVDGRAAAFLQSPGLAHDSKSSFHFTVTGSGVRFDEVRIWQAH